MQTDSKPRGWIPGALALSGLPPGAGRHHRPPRRAGGAPRRGRRRGHACRDYGASRGARGNAAHVPRSCYGERTGSG